MPTLAEVLAIMSGRAAIAVEIKNIPGEPAFEPVRQSIVEAVHAELERFDGAVLVVSFNPPRSRPRRCSRRTCRRGS